MSKDDLTPLELTVYEFLGVGQENAVTSTWFKDFKGINRRTLCEVVERLRLQGVPIGSNRTGEHKGYYIIDNAEELRATIAQYTSQVARMCRIISKLKESELANENQIELFEF